MLQGQIGVQDIAFWYLLYCQATEVQLSLSAYLQACQSFHCSDAQTEDSRINSRSLVPLEMSAGHLKEVFAPM